MATNARNQSGRDYQSWDEARREQAEDRERDREHQRSEDRVQAHLRNHPSDSLAEAYYKTRQ